MHSMPMLGGGCRRNIAMPFGTEKLEWCGYTMVKKFWRYLYSFWHDPRLWQSDRHTHRQTPHDGIGRTYAQHRAAIIVTVPSWKCVGLTPIWSNFPDVHYVTFLKLFTIVLLIQQSPSHRRIDSDIINWNQIRLYLTDMVFNMYRIK